MLSRTGRLCMICTCCLNPFASACWFFRALFLPIAATEYCTCRSQVTAQTIFMFSPSVDSGLTEAVLRERLKQLGWAQPRDRRISSLVIIEVLPHPHLLISSHPHLVSRGRWRAGERPPTLLTSKLKNARGRFTRKGWGKFGVAADASRTLAVRRGGNVDHARAAGAGRTLEGVEPGRCCQ